MIMFLLKQLKCELSCQENLAIIIIIKSDYADW